MCLTLPMTSQTLVYFEEVAGCPDMVVVKYGNDVLANKHGFDLTALKSRDNKSDVQAFEDSKTLYNINVLIGEREKVLSRFQKMKVAGGQFIVSGLEGPNGKLSEMTFVPLVSIVDSVASSEYVVRWKLLTKKEYANALYEEFKDEYNRLLDKRTIDAVNTGEQQPEADHFMTCELSEIGNGHGEPWRKAHEGGYFGYKMKTLGHDNLNLMLRCHGSKPLDERLDITIDGKPLTPNVTKRDRFGEFSNIEFAIPAEMLTGKELVDVRISGKSGTATDFIYYLRLVTPDPSTAP